MLSGRLVHLMAVVGIVCGLAKAAPSSMLDPHLQVVDLSDLIAPLPLNANSLANAGLGAQFMVQSELAGRRGRHAGDALSGQEHPRTQSG